MFTGEDPGVQMGSKKPLLAEPDKAA